MTESKLTRDEVLALSKRIIDYCSKKLSKVPANRTAVNIACAFNISRMLEFTRASHVLLSNDPVAPVAIAILARPQMESAITLLTILRPSHDPDREELATRYIAFAEYEHMKLLGDHCDAFRATLTPEEADCHDRRVQIAQQVKASFDSKQLKQTFPTWNGLTIKKTIQSLDLPDRTTKWYELLSAIVHGSPSMLHKSLTIDEEGIKLHQVDYGLADASTWMDKMCTMLLLSVLTFLERQGIEGMDDEGRAIATEMGFKQ